MMLSSTIKSKAPTFIVKKRNALPGAQTNTSNTTSSAESLFTSSDTSSVSSLSSVLSEKCVQNIPAKLHQGLLELNNYARPVNFLHPTTCATISVQPQTKLKFTVAYGATPVPPEGKIQQTSVDSLSVYSHATTQPKASALQRAWFFTLAFAYGCIAFVQKTFGRIRSFFSEKYAEKQRARNKSSELTSSPFSALQISVKTDTASTCPTPAYGNRIQSLKKPMLPTEPTHANNALGLGAWLPMLPNSTWQASLFAAENANLIWGLDKLQQAFTAAKTHATNAALWVQAQPTWGQVFSQAASAIGNTPYHLIYNTLPNMKVYMAQGNSAAVSQDKEPLILSGNAMSMQSIDCKFTKPIDLLFDPETFVGKLFSKFTIGRIKIDQGEVAIDGTGYIFNSLPLPINWLLGLYKRVMPTQYAQMMPMVETSIDSMIHGKLLSWGEVETVIDVQPTAHAA